MSVRSRRHRIGEQSAVMVLQVAKDFVIALAVVFVVCLIGTLMGLGGIHYSPRFRRDFSPRGAGGGGRGPGRTQPHRRANVCSCSLRLLGFLALFLRSIVALILGTNGETPPGRKVMPNARCPDHNAPAGLTPGRNLSSKPNCRSVAA